MVPIVKHNYDAVPELRFAAPGREIVMWRLNQWGWHNKITNDWSSLGPELDQAVELLDLMHSAVQKPFYDSQFDFKTGLVDPWFNCNQMFKVARSAQILILRGS